MQKYNFVKNVMMKVNPAKVDEKSKAFARNLSSSKRISPVSLIR